MNNNIGLYLHIPFCRRKCAYCDFYSSFASEALMDKYVNALLKETERWGSIVSRPVDTVYIGGGTPSLLGKRIIPVMRNVYSSFRVLPETEITAEMNPGGDCTEFLEAAALCGVTRLSIGLQSADNGELRLLGRTHTADDARKTVDAARKLGFANISLDLMIGLPYSSIKTLEKSIDYIISINPEHVSSYILKIEPNTAFGKIKISQPDDDEQAEQYLYMCERFEKAGYLHYEISNFAKPSYESRHNLKYWKSEEYIGIGPAAHSFLNGERFYYPRDLKGFIENPRTVSDGSGGDAEERLMLGLRISDGVDFSPYPDALPLIQKFVSAGLGKVKNGRFSLTDSGMLVSNSIITEFSETIL